jgi:hypothetical protein
MPIVEITPEEDRSLKARAPEYLKGKRNAKRRVRWALEQLFNLMPCPDAPNRKPKRRAPPKRDGRSSLLLARRDAHVCSK